ncbi:MAG: fasciclin domain-containing protein [Parvularculaceae bacterium]|nr:fasciclin domain-containing protein [Parvularculaceae bacterium]
MLKNFLAATAAFTLAAAPALARDHDAKKTTITKGDIVDTAVSAGQFTTLVAAVQAAGLESALRAPGPITVFAPTDAAFAALPAGTVDDLLKPENKDKLAAILTYHVANGKTKSKDLVGKRLEVTTLNGAKLSVDGTNGVKVGPATVTKADNWASNGVIHVIDTVLLPPTN